MYNAGIRSVNLAGSGLGNPMLKQRTYKLGLLREVGTVATPGAR